MTIADPCLRAAVEAASSAGPPTRVEATHVRTLEGLDAVATLEVLCLDAAELDDLEVLTKLPRLRELRLRYCLLRDIAALSRCVRVERLELLLSSATQLEPIPAMPALELANLAGCPWDASPASDAVARLRARLTRSWVSSERYWELTRALHDAQAGLCYDNFLGRRILVRPGVARREGAVCDCLIGPSPGDLGHDLQQSDDPSALFDAIVARRGEPGPPSPEVGAPVMAGYREDALGWLAEAEHLPASLVAALRRLVDGFPSLRWARCHAQTIPKIEAALQGPAPAWYLNMFATLSAPEPGVVSWQRLRSTRVRDEPFSVAPIYEGWDMRGPALRRFGLMPIAIERAHSPMLLAVRAAGTPDDPVVLVPGRHDMPTAFDGLRVVFPSYVAFVDAVTAVEFEGGARVPRASAGR